MSEVLERLLVGAIVLAAGGYALRSLLPLAWRAALARRLAGRVPERLRIWLAGSRGCADCGPSGRTPRP
ncbi:MAG: hypothetical protein JSR54_06940 [Proteobacteria bacterium]|nr:hypothetical protein [Pseudomonadota bacterium]